MQNFRQHWLLWLLGVFVTCVGFVASVYQIGGGPPMPVDPEIHFRDTSDGSSLILPFTIRDRSGLFDMPDVVFRCGVDLVIARDAKGQTVVIRDVAFLNGIKSLAVGSTPTSYRCNAADIFKLRSDGSLSIYGSATILQSSVPQVYEPPWTILKMCVWIGGEYRVVNIVPWSFTSQIFQWPAMRGSHQWLEGGPTVGEDSPEAQEERRNGLMSGALQCSKEVMLPYSLVAGPGEMILVLPPIPTGTLGIVPLPPTL
jgi:hypothetical protein